MRILNAMQAAARSLAAALIQPASAHCDTEDGPAVQDGRRALETGNPNYALKWVHAEGEEEVRASFDAAQAARGRQDADRAARAFLETLVRVHRAGEGAGFDGIQPTGTELPAEVVAADAALDAGTIEPLRGLIPDDRWDELQKRFTVALAKKGFDVDDLDAARDYVAAYVQFFKYAEGEDDHHHHGSHDHAVHQHR
ncbi:DUF6448 family protein [Rhodococcus chondri]|uniref:DUF6448 family protein n=1 Tax=Rhodococcus chondri TaxID=3065941 RepID=A0ABU7JUD9_9NOCA|nr:DUF6448 family protein [Rhodococcus sp. CC-R104]MEE2032892.1 DUF6448 family protein [Rhodococcus sp. CC-R104]